MSDRKISACIVSYGGYDEVILAANSLIHNTNGDFHLYLVDNNSDDNTGNILLDNFKSNDKVTVMPLSENVGFGKGHNACMDNLSSTYHAVVNPDITIDNDVLNTLCDYLDEHEDVVMVTPQLKFPDGTLQQVAKRRPTFMALLSRQLPFKFLKKYENHYLMLDEDLTTEKDVEFCTGCFFVVRTDVFKKFGGFDKDYFMYVEDADITQRALKHGRVVFLPTTYVYHAWHRSTRKNLSSFLLQLKSMFLYFKKWGFKLK